MSRAATRDARVSTPSWRRLTRLLALAIGCAAATACGMKGPPLPPLQRIPAEPQGVSPQRYDRDVYISYTVPATNVEGIGTATIDRVEVYAITLTEALGTREVQTEALRKAATLVAREHVRVPLPPPPPSSDPNKPPPPPIPQEPGLDQGATAVARETLTDALLEPVPMPVIASISAAARAARPAAGGTSTAATGPGVGPPPPPGAADPDADVAGDQLASPDVADEFLPAAAPTFVVNDTNAPKRYYFVVGVTANGRYGRATAPIAVPLAPVTGVPSAPAVAYDETTTTLKWTPAADAHGAPEPVGDLLPSRSMLPAPPPTKYDVFAVASADAVKDVTMVLPRPLNGEPLSTAELAVPGVKFGAERCFVVRPVDTIAGVAVRGPASAPACVTPRDTFAPATPQQLAAIAGAGNISLIWEPNSEPDLVGYIVLRGDGTSDRLTPLTPSPIRETTFRDTNVTPGSRYVYAIVAVDNAMPQNVSAQSARVEETARQ